MKTRRIQAFILISSIITGLLLTSGCLSSNPGSSSLAYVVINDASSEEIQAESIRIFEENFYDVEHQSEQVIIFLRKGTQRDNVLHGGLLNSELYMRVTVTISPFREGGFLVRADAFVLRQGLQGPADSLLRMSRRPYQDLLDRMKASLVTASGE